jgi:hypothetical protein
MINYHSSEGNNKRSPDSGNPIHIIPIDYTGEVIEHGAAAGDTNNESLKVCYICKARGFPHEAIEFRVINSGRTKTDGTFEHQRYELTNYFTGRKHEHKTPRSSI